MAQRLKLTSQSGVINLNNKKITGLATPVANTDAATKAYVDSTSIGGTVGTVTSGTWNGSTITVPYGGTGAATLTANSVLLGNGTSAISGSTDLTYASSTLTLASGKGLTVGGTASFGNPILNTNISFTNQTEGLNTGTLSATIQGVIFLGASVTALTTALPAGTNGQKFIISSVGGVSGTFTLTASGATFATSPPTTLSAGQVLRYIYRSADTKWYQI